MFGLGTQELLIILVLVMVIFGAGKLPQVGAALGKGIRNFKKGVNEVEEIGLADLDDKKKPESTPERHEG
jgi:sec-independent protein translocase protein TatA